MELKILATSLALCLLASAAALAMEKPAAGHMPMGNVGTQQVGARPMLLAADSTYLEQRSARLQRANGKKTFKHTQRRQVRETNPWWR
ncbi:hypothetical protein [Halomonas sp. I5-271120]|uniref:hypothetical protein n=1 Tax=Halomonas sp. I5-271120 TaxID=3061632 RepID=UPI002714A89E|nr:hypothetical protein [Halomonas sp. I5-271120]